MHTTDLSIEEIYRKLLDRQDRESIVYFIGAEGSDLIKIGTTQDIGHRMAGLNTASPLRLILLSIVQGDKHSESLLHRAFSATKLRGEWFSPNRKLYELIDLINRNTHSQTKHRIAKINAIYWPEGFDLSIKDHHEEIKRIPWQEHSVYVFVAPPFSNSHGMGRKCKARKIKE